MNPVVQAEAAPSAHLTITPNLIFLLVGALLCGVLRFAWGTVEDDAYITFTYARNLVAGNGFVFNPGEMVMGTTVPLFGLFVALGIRIGIDPALWVFGWDVVWMGAVLWMMKEFMEITGAARWFPFAALMIPFAAQNTLPVPGMETGAYMVFLFGSVLAVMRRAPHCAMWLAGIAAVIRPDGIAAIAAVAPFAFAQVPRAQWLRVWPLLALPTLLVPAQALVLWHWYGSPVPHSVWAKRLTGAQVAPETRFLAVHISTYYKLYTHFHAVGLLALLGTVLAFCRRDHLPLSALVVCYTGFFIIGRAPDFLWYRTPLFVLMYVFAARGLGAMTERLWPARAGLLAMALVPIVTLPQFIIYNELNWRGLMNPGIHATQRRYRDAALWIRKQNDAPRTLACHEVGYLAYFLEGRVDDLEGLMSPASLAARREGVDPLSRTDAFWFVQSVLKWDPPDVRTRAIERAGRHGFVQVRSFTHEYGQTMVFRRTSTVAPKPW